jgi:signal transduction histidine kinase
LVEDDEAHAELIHRAFDTCGQGMDLTVASSLREAQACLARSDIDLVITDLLLPDGKGTELLAVDEGPVRLPLLVITGRGDEQEAVAAMKSGALGYVVKSAATLADMPQIADRALREWENIAARRQAEKELRKHRDHLEELIEERTSELNTANEQLKSEIAERKLAEEALRRERRLLRELLDLQERDRKLVSYEIHDGLAQQLTGALFRLQASERVEDLGPDEARKTYDGGIALLQEAIAEARRLISGLRPPVLDESGVVAAIEYLVHEGERIGAPAIEFVVDVQFDRLASPLETAIFRVVQEALTNACRHSRSPKVEVRLVQEGDRVWVRIEDWGVGFDPDGVHTGRFGLQGIQERARLMGGRADILSAPNQGTRITVELPLLERAPEDGGVHSL